MGIDLIGNCCIDCHKPVSTVTAKRCKSCYLSSELNPFKTGTNWKDALPNCKICNIKLTRMDAIYCGECYHSMMKGSKHPNFKGGYDRNYPFCVDCNKKLTAKHCIRCRDCYKIWSKIPENNPMYGTVGELSPNWINGISFEPYPIEFNNNLKYHIKKRDNFICQNCIMDKNLIIHHIDYNKQNCNEDNLITLCNSCNSIANFNRDYWFAFYRYILDNNLIIGEK